MYAHLDLQRQGFPFGWYSMDDRQVASAIYQADHDATKPSGTIAITDTLMGIDPMILAHQYLSPVLMSTSSKHKGTVLVHSVYAKNPRLPDRPPIPEHPAYDLYKNNLTKIVEAIHKQNPVASKVATTLQEAVASTSASANASTHSKPTPFLPPASDAGSRISRISSPLSQKSPTTLARSIPIPASPPGSDVGDAATASTALHKLLRKYDSGLAPFALDVTVSNILKASDEEGRKKALEDLVAEEDLPPMYDQVVMIMRNPSEPPPPFEFASQYQNHAQTNQESSPEEGGVEIPLQPPFTHAPPNGTMPQMLSSRAEARLTSGARTMQGIFTSYRHGTITSPASKKQPFNSGRSFFMVYISFSTRSITRSEVQSASPARDNEFGAIFIHVVVDGEQNVEKTICFNQPLQVPGIGRTSPRNTFAIVAKSDIRQRNMNPISFIAGKVIGPATFNPSINTDMFQNGRTRCRPRLHLHRPAIIQLLEHEGL
ncbi:hypothetical protein BJ165DRAFT_1523254 [Panaeolus papilionaceus]|nr:hypothetical protein BJ165DRAFT_1523254 [Panaeolus papilionaceus]